mmetsp:Transcript_46384/g.140513  ORF Transcript_46384/g.140513 Transcript_46384/m.140513 type:complete len:225 (+) Transcript_46384:2084-2758(+)
MRPVQSTFGTLVDIGLVYFGVQRRLRRRGDENIGRFYLCRWRNRWHCFIRLICRKRITFVTIFTLWLSGILGIVSISTRSRLSTFPNCFQYLRCFPLAVHSLLRLLLFLGCLLSSFGFGIKLLECLKERGCCVKCPRCSLARRTCPVFGVCLCENAVRKPSTYQFRLFPTEYGHGLLLCLELLQQLTKARLSRARGRERYSNLNSILAAIIRYNPRFRIGLILV